MWDSRSTHSYVFRCNILQDLRVCSENVILMQVACGPHHMAAVVAAGRLYTWGDGFAGKLGHGDRRGCAEPRVVEGLRHLQVRLLDD